MEEPYISTEIVTLQSTLKLPNKDVKNEDANCISITDKGTVKHEV